MKYRAPVVRTEAEIEHILGRSEAAPDERISAVLSAIFYAKNNEYAGDTLIAEFNNARYPEKIYLMNLFETFHQACATSYRIDESIDSLENYRRQSQEQIKPEISEVIDALLEFKEMFKGRSAD